MCKKDQQTSGRRTIRMRDSGGIFGRHKKGAWRRQGGVGKGSRAIKTRARKQDNEGVCARV